MVGVLYKPANQRVAAITTRNDKLGGQGPPSPTLSGSTNSYHWNPCSHLLYVCYLVTSGSLPSTVNCDYYWLLIWCVIIIIIRYTN